MVVDLLLQYEYHIPAINLCFFSRWGIILGGCGNFWKCDMIRGRKTLKVIGQDVSFPTSPLGILYAPGHDDLNRLFCYFLFHDHSST